MRHLIPFLLICFLAAPAFAQSGWRAGWVPAHEVQSAVRNLRKPLYRCYVDHVPEKSRQHGDIATLKVVVSETGNVFRVDFLEGSTRSKKFDRCLRKLFEGLKFPTKPTEKTTFVQKIGFQNGLDKMLLEPPQAAGGAITKASVVELAKSRQAEIQACYKQSLAAKPELRGQVLVEIVTGKSGAVEQARVVKTTLNDAATENCVLGIVRNFAFPVPDDPSIVVLQFPLTFNDDQ